VNPANEFDAKWRDSLRCSRPTYYVLGSGNSMMIRFSMASTARLLGCAGYALATAALLAGCHSDAYYDAQAPSPTVNPNAHAYSHLKITAEPGSGVDRVEVLSIWTIDNIGCAPLRPYSGAPITKQVEVKEKVVKVAGYYLVTKLDDRFLPGKCRWDGDGYDIRFMHGDTLLASTGAGPGNFNGSNVIKLTCMPPPHFPTCDLRNREAFDRSHFKGVFNAAVEIVK